MRTIGVRELRQHASRFLALVQAGETVEVTVRGRPVALLVPIGARGPMEGLLAAGRIAPADGDLMELGEPIEGRSGVILPSEILAGVRADER